jgi:DNA-directed RNA polymerase subunit RPC12/RpoP
MTKSKCQSCGYPFNDIQIIEDAVSPLESYVYARCSYCGRESDQLNLRDIMRNAIKEVCEIEGAERE